MSVGHSPGEYKGYGFGEHMRYDWPPNGYRIMTFFRAIIYPKHKGHSRSLQLQSPPENFTAPNSQPVNAKHYI